MPTEDLNQPPSATPAMSEEDAAYFQRRAEEELEMAQKATRPDVVAAHVALADAYLERIHVGSPRREYGAGNAEENKND